MNGTDLTSIRTRLRNELQLSAWNYYGDIEISTQYEDPPTFDVEMEMDDRIRISGTMVYGLEVEPKDFHVGSVNIYPNGTIRMEDVVFTGDLE